MLELVLEVEVVMLLVVEVLVDWVVLVDSEVLEVDIEVEVVVAIRTNSIVSHMAVIIAPELRLAIFFQPISVESSSSNVQAEVEAPGKSYKVME